MCYALYLVSVSVYRFYLFVLNYMIPLISIYTTLLVLLFDKLYKLYLTALIIWLKMVSNTYPIQHFVLLLLGGLNSPEPPPPDSSPSVSVDHRQLPIQVRDGYLIFQVSKYNSVAITDNNCRTCAF